MRTSPPEPPEGERRCIGGDTDSQCIHGTSHVSGYCTEHRDQAPPRYTSGRYGGDEVLNEAEQHDGPIHGYDW